MAKKIEFEGEVADFFHNKKLAVKPVLDDKGNIIDFCMMVPRNLGYKRGQRIKVTAEPVKQDKDKELASVWVGLFCNVAKDR